LDANSAPIKYELFPSVTSESSVPDNNAVARYSDEWSLAKASTAALGRQPMRYPRLTGNAFCIKLSTNTGAEIAKQWVLEAIYVTTGQLGRTLLG